MVIFAPQPATWGLAAAGLQVPAGMTFSFPQPAAVAMAPPPQPMMLPPQPVLAQPMMLPPQPVLAPQQSFHQASNVVVNPAQQYAAQQPYPPQPQQPFAAQPQQLGFPPAQVAPAPGMYPPQLGPPQGQGYPPPQQNGYAQASYSATSSSTTTVNGQVVAHESAGVYKSV
jgi:hypothetical protein